MFFCEPCRVKNKWPEGWSQSAGRCECCGSSAVCHDVTSSRLPQARNQEEKCRPTYGWVQLPSTKKKAFLLSMEPQLFLTGSRFFDAIEAPKRRADVDLYTQYTGAVEAGLRDAGFVRIDSHYAGIENNFVSMVFEGTIEMINHHIIMVKDVELFHKAQEAIYAFKTAFNKMDKDTRKKVYQACLKAADQP